MRLLGGSLRTSFRVSEILFKRKKTNLVGRRDSNTRRSFGSSGLLGSRATDSPKAVSRNYL